MCVSFSSSGFNRFYRISQAFVGLKACVDNSVLERGIVKALRVIGGVDAKKGVIKSGELSLVF